MNSCNLGFRIHKSSKFEKFRIVKLDSVLYGLKLAR